MNIYKCEYIWLDGSKPEQMLRGKTLLHRSEHFDGDVSQLPERGFDGSSTNQAEGHASDCRLHPVRAVRDCTRDNGWIVMCEVLHADGTPHSSDSRSTISDDSEEIRFGFEQEYVLGVNGKPLGFPEDGYPAPQGHYYCGVGSPWMVGREIVEEHLHICLEAGLYIDCINAEVLKGQWEFGLFSKGAKNAGDELWIARYFMMRLCEKYGLEMILHPKPVLGDWNGTGMHCNFSNKRMRDEGGEQYFTDICEAFGKRIDEHIAVYGSDNHLRLTGAHETQRIDQFSYGVSDRGASIRIPLSTVLHDWKGRLEDRRVAANADPYKVAAVVIETLQSVK